MLQLNSEDSMDTSSLWAFTFLWTFVSCSPVEGVFRMISPSQPVVAEPGDDVILPCQLNPPLLNVENSVVRWWRPDLQPDPSDQNWVDIVLLYYDMKEAPEKIPSYVNRTQLFTEELKHGNVSLKILNVTSGDAGRYRCDIPNLQKFSIIQLVVDPDLKTRTTEMQSFSQDLQTPDPRDKTDDEEVDQTRHCYWILPVVFCFFFVPTVIIIGFSIKQQHQKQTHKQKHDVECDVVLNTQCPVQVL